MIKANQYFESLVEKLQEKSFKPCRGRYKDGTYATCKSIYGWQEKYNIEEGEFPVNTYRATPIDKAIQEIFWIYQDQTSELKPLQDRSVNYWNDWTVDGGKSIGYAYGKTIKDYNLINTTLKEIVGNPFSRRHIINLWQIPHIEKQLSIGGLVPCAYETMWSIEEEYGKRYISLTLNQRSSDFLVAGNINRIQYVALGMMIASHLTNQTGIIHIVKEFTWNVQDIHVYDRHYTKMLELYCRKDVIQKQSSIRIKRDDEFYNLRFEDFIIDKPKLKTFELDIVV